MLSRERDDTTIDVSDGLYFTIPSAERAVPDGRDPTHRRRLDGQRCSRTAVITRVTL